MLDARAYERAVKPLLRQAGAYARALTGNTHDAEDAVQQAALRAWERIDQYDEARAFKGWWFAILRNCCLDTLRRRKTARTQDFSGFDPPAPSESEGFDWERLESALAGLSAAHQEVLRFKYFGGLSYSDLAEALAIPIGTVMSRLHLARKALAAILREDPQ